MCWAPTSHLAGPVRSSDPLSHGGSWPSTGSASTRVSTSSESKPRRGVLLGLAVAVWLGLAGGDVVARVWAAIVPPESFELYAANRTVSFHSCQPRG